MERLTLREANGCVLPGFENNGVNGCYDIPDAEWLEESIDRLAAIEDILGDDYDLNRLRVIMDAEQHGGLIVGYGPGDPGEPGEPGELGVMEEVAADNVVGADL